MALGNGTISSAGPGPGPGPGAGKHVARGPGGAASRSRSLERLLDEAAHSGELALPARKLREFPHTDTQDASSLHDTLIADLSKNRFSEVPEEVTEFYFLEKLLLCNNAIRSIPESVVMLQSLTYLDLSRNQLFEIPRELCQLPLQVLLLSNNRLTSLPKELGKMSTLAELDASGNMISQLPITIGDLTSLRSLNLKCNQLGLLPIQITYLKLEILDVSCNCISSLPLELRNMTDLVVLKLEHNPLVSPPATICVKGRIHIFKYLENQLNKDNLQRRDDIRRSTKQPAMNNHVQNYSTIGHSQPASSAVIDGLRHRVRYNVDSGYSTSDGGEKRWSSDGTVAIDDPNVTPIGLHSSGRSTPSTPSTISPGQAYMSRAHSLSTDTPPSTPILGSRLSPDGAMDEKIKLGPQQTYKQYKEALRQQRQQDVYRPRNDQTSPSATTPTMNHSQSTPHSPVANGYHSKFSMSSSQSLSSPNCSSPTNGSPAHSNRKYQTSTPTNTVFQTNGMLNHDDSNQTNKKPIQKVVPSRNISKNGSLPGSTSNNTLSFPIINGNTDQDDSYSKPLSPVKGSSGFMSHNSLPANRSSSLGRNITADQVCGNTMQWRNKDMTPDKLSFTMKREFDKAKEESDLIQQLRNIIETRLKMTLPKDIAPALSDGVVLCHLANHVRPRAVASVHVPSPGQPKLSMARCRRNVDNFLEACRRIGVEEEAMCDPQDILPSEDSGHIVDDFHKTAAIYQTVSTLLAHRSTPAHAIDNHHAPRSHKDMHQHPLNNDTLSTDDQLESSSYYSDPTLPKGKSVQRNRYAEDRCISNFNTASECVDDVSKDDLNMQSGNSVHKIKMAFENRQAYENNYHIEKYEKPRVNFVSPIFNELKINKYDDFDDAKHPKDVNYYAAKRANMNLKINNNLNALQTDFQASKQNDQLISRLCMGIFIFTMISLYLFPLPN